MLGMLLSILSPMVMDNSCYWSRSQPLRCRAHERLTPGLENEGHQGHQTASHRHKQAEPLEYGGPARHWLRLLFYTKRDRFDSFL